MKHQIICNPTYSAVEVQLEAGERLLAESGSMAWMSSNVKTETAVRGGLLAGMKRKFLTGESFFQNTYHPEGGPGSVTLAPGTVGDIVAHTLWNSELLLEKGAYLASTEGVACDAKWGGLKGFFNEGMFVLRVTGSGTLFFNAYGDIHPVDVAGDYVVDNGYAVAWEPSLTYHLTRSKKIRSFLFSDQLLLRFSGRGRVWVQSRSPRSLANWVHPFRRVQSKSS
ncbi:MAG: TIGR00266 family protein [Planctomycetes bacterium]|nr:TIGR00266 family protein [Planctomycetota bacterium]